MSIHGHTPRVKDIINRFRGREELDNTEKATQYVLYEIQEALLTMSRITLK